MMSVELLKSLMQQPKVIVEYYEGYEDELHIYTRTRDYVPVFICVMGNDGFNNDDFQIIKDQSLDTIAAGIKEWAKRVLGIDIMNMIVYPGSGSTKY